MKDNKFILKGILDIGAQMMKSGAENPRVEDSMIRMCRAYGFVHADVFVIPSNIQATVQTADGDIFTQIRYIDKQNVNMDRLDYLNNLSRRICKEAPDEDRLQELLQEVLNRKEQPKWLRYLAAIMAGGGFCVFFAGNAVDAVLASLVSLIVLVLGDVLGKKENNPLIYNSILAFIAEFIIIVCVHFGFAENTGSITTGFVMLLISAIATTNGIRDLLHKDIFSGILNIINSIIGAAGIVIGIVVAMIIFQGVM